MKNTTTTNIPMNANIDQQIRVDQIKYVYRPFNSVVATYTLGSIALLIGMWETAPRADLLAWFVIIQIVNIYRFGIYLHFRRHFTPLRVEWYARHFTVGSAIYGLFWGLCALLFFPHHSEPLQFFMLAMILGAGVIGVVTKFALLPALKAYLPISFLPLLIQLFRIGDTLHTAMAVGVIAFFIATYVYANYAYLDLINTFRLRYENTNLVEQLRAQKEEAERANIAKSKFLAAASHDLRQPLHALTLFTSALQETAQSEKAQKLVGQVDTSVTALKSLFDALLDISRLDAGTIQVEKTHFPLQSLLTRLANDFDPQAREKGLQLHWPTCNFVVYTDINLFEQILRNFLSNAVRYTGQGDIYVQCGSRDGRVYVDVTDTGIGIPPDKVQLIFDEFQQLNNPERDRSKGLGLGLAIVQRTAQLLGHRIDVQSEPGIGSTFSILTDPGNAARVQPDVPVDCSLTSNHCDAALIMVIDDEYSVLEGMDSLLRLWGYEVITASDQQEALERIADEGISPDAIIADYRLRDNRTGIEAVLAIHQQYSVSIPALIVTGDIAAEQLREVHDSGLQILHKPVAPGKLRSFLRNAQLQYTKLKN